MQYKRKSMMIERPYYDYAEEDPQNGVLPIPGGGYRGELPVIARLGFLLGLIITPILLFNAFFGG